MSWKTTRLVEFQHCDPAGWVFYPRYFEMINSTIEEFFRSRLESGFGAMHLHDGRGVPTARIEVEFKNPSRLEDFLTFSLSVKNVGNSSVSFEIECASDGEIRFECCSTLVQIDLQTGKSIAWAPDLRQKLQSV